MFQKSSDMHHVGQSFSYNIVRDV